MQAHGFYPIEILTPDQQKIASRSAYILTNLEYVKLHTQEALHHASMTEYHLARRAYAPADEYMNVMLPNRVRQAKHLSDRIWVKAVSAPPKIKQWALDTADEARAIAEKATAAYDRAKRNYDTARPQ